VRRSKWGLFPWVLYLFTPRPRAAPGTFPRASARAGAPPASPLCQLAAASTSKRIRGPFDFPDKLRGKSNSMNHGAGPLPRNSPVRNRFRAIFLCRDITQGLPAAKPDLPPWSSVLVWPLLLTDRRSPFKPSGKAVPELPRHEACVLPRGFRPRDDVLGLLMTYIGRLGLRFQEAAERISAPDDPPESPPASRTWGFSGGSSGVGAETCPGWRWLRVGLVGILGPVDQKEVFRSLCDSREPTGRLSTFALTTN